MKTQGTGGTGSRTIRFMSIVDPENTGSGDEVELSLRYSDP